MCPKVQYCCCICGNNINHAYKSEYTVNFQKAVKNASNSVFILVAMDFPIVFLQYKVSCSTLKDTRVFVYTELHLVCIS